MPAERGLSCGAEISTFVIFPFVVTMVAWTAPYCSVTIEPAYCPFGVFGAAVAVGFGADAGLAVGTITGTAVGWIVGTGLGLLLEASVVRGALDVAAVISQATAAAAAAPSTSSSAQ